MIIAVGALGACVDAPLEENEEALLGDISTQSCDVEERALLQDAAAAGRVAAVSPYFESCLASALAGGERYRIPEFGGFGTVRLRTRDMGPYDPCHEDPFVDTVDGSFSDEDRYRGLLQASRSPSDSAITCGVAIDGIAEAGVFGHGTRTESHVWSDDWLPSASALYSANANTAHLAMTAAVLWHETMHNWGYRHDPRPGCGEYLEDAPTIVGGCIGAEILAADSCNLSCGADHHPVRMDDGLGAAVECACIGDPAQMGQYAASSIWHQNLGDDDQVFKTGDVNGDGRDDIVQFIRDTRTGSLRGDVYVALSLGSSFATPIRWSGWFCIGEEICDVADVDGDGLDDIVAFTRGTTGDVWVARSNGFSFGSGVKWNGWFCVGQEECRTGDINGDGRADIVAFVGDTRTGISRGDVWVALSNGAGFVSPRTWHGWFCLSGEQCEVSDVDGDGRDDLVAFVRRRFSGSARGDVFVAASQGDRFASSSKWHEYFCGDQETCAMADVDGDRHADLIAFQKSTRTGSAKGDVWAAEAQVDTFDSSRRLHGWFCIDDEICLTGDFDGNGADDLAALTLGNGHNVWVSLSR